MRIRTPRCSVGEGPQAVVRCLLVLESWYVDEFRMKLRKNNNPVRGHRCSRRNVTQRPGFRSPRRLAQAPQLSEGLIPGNPWVCSLPPCPDGALPHLMTTCPCPQQNDGSLGCCPWPRGSTLPVVSPERGWESAASARMCPEEALFRFSLYGIVWHRPLSALQWVRVWRDLQGPPQGMSLPQAHSPARPSPGHFIPFFPRRLDEGGLPAQGPAGRQPYTSL